MKIILFAVAILFAVMELYSQDSTYKLPDVVVTAGRTPVSFSELTRSVEIITAEEIENNPVNNIQDLLQYAAGLDVKQRGTEGVQSDISIRGGSFEQTLIMVDGVKLSDPQTGHHNLNLPISLGDVERIEILKGQGAKFFGANAFSGVINIITKKEKANRVHLNAMGGHYGLYELGINTSYTAGIFSNRLSLSKKKSDGYRYNTGFNAYNVLYNSTININDNRISLLFGHNDKEFGANGFYTTSPEQWEHTITSLLSAQGNINAGIFSISPKISWRKHKDRYLLNYKNPSLYENNHTTHVLDYELQASFTTIAGVSTIGGEITQDEIKSTNLGNHTRVTKGIFAEQKFTVLDNLNLSLGVFAYNYPSIGWKYWPGIDLSYMFSQWLRFYSSAGKAFRIPSFTDLFYKGGGSEGNPNLKHEETINYEAGLFVTQKTFIVNLCFFRKEGKNIIDWFYNPVNNIWKSDNVSEITTNGVEMSADYYPVSDLFYQLGMNYTYLDLKKSTVSSVSRYLPDHLRHQVIFNIGNYLPFNIKQNWMFRFEDRVNSEDNFIIDTGISYKISGITLFVKAANLLNNSNKDMQLIPLPGRWITAGFDTAIGY